MSPNHHRIIVVGLVWNNEGRLLLCKMASDRGVFPGQWGLPGGGIELDETMEDALRRELGEELGIEIDTIKPAFFKDGFHDKSLPGGAKKSTYMIFLVFNCRSKSNKIILNKEFDEYLWAERDDIKSLDLNEETKDTLARIGDWKAVFS